MPDIAELGLSIDTRQLEQGAQAMDRLGAASQSVEKKVDSATSAIDKLGKASADAKGKTAEGAAAVDAVGEAGARVVQKVDAATASIDAMGATATRIRTVFLGGSNTLDGFMGSSMGVWRSSEAAAAGIDSLGNATERTWKKQADYNGAMADTTRIMRQAADAARTLEESNHRMLIELQREIDTFGMARGELERYRAAELGLGSAAQTKAAALGNSIDAMHREERAARDAAGAQDRAAQAGDRFIKSLQDQVATLGMTTQQLQTYRAAQLGVSDAASPLINKLAEAGAGAKSAGGHMEGLSFQSASAKRELLVLAHELSQGQFQRFGGSMMVLGEQTGAASLLFSAAGLAALAFAGALGTVGYAMIKGASEQREMNNALISTNNYAGVTSDKLNEMAHAATEAGGSIREAKKVVTELAGTGKFTGDQIAYITDAVIALEHATGESVKKTIKEFESLAVQSTGSTNRATEVITRATVKLDDTYHFLTLSVYEAIRALEKDGDAKGASAVATEAFAKATKDGAEQMIANLGSVARAWHGVKEAVGGAMDAIGNYGKKDTAASDVKKYSFRLSEFDKGLADSNLRLGRAPDAITPELQATRTQIVLGLTDAVDKLNKADAVALAQGEVATKNSRAVHAAAMIHAEDIRLQKKGMGELAVALDAYQSNIDAIRAADPNSPLITPDAIASGIAARKKAHTEQVKPKADQVENTAMADRLARIQDDVNLEKERIGQLAKINEMFHKAGRLGDEEYFKNKRDNARAAEQEEINGYTRQIAVLKDHHNATGVEAEKNSKKANDLDAKRAAAILRAADAVELTEMEEMLRKDALSEAAVLATNKEIGAINAQIAVTEEQIRTYGLLPAQKTALAVADLEEQKAALASFDGNEKVIDGINRKIEAMKRLGIVQGKASAQERGGDVARAKELLDILTAVDTATKSAAQGMTASFGAVGTAIGGLTTALSGYAVQQQAIAAQLAVATKDAYGDPTKLAKAQAAAAQQGAQAQIKSYGDMANSAKGFFKENTAGYRAMEGAERAYRAVEMAMAIESMVKKLFAVEVVTTATLGAEAAKTVAIQAGTATQIAADTVKGTSAAAVAVATQAQGDPYSAWIRMAAMAAAMAALGFAVSGGGGSDTTAKDRQAATGTGSILGDSSAKSESIAHSLAIMEKNSGLGLAHTISMDLSLKQMVSGIGNLAGLLARSGVTAAGGGAAAGVQTGTTTLGGSLGMAAGTLAGGVGGAALGTYLGMGMAAIGGPLGLAVGAVLGSVLGGVVSKLFNTSTSIKDQGITGKAMSLGNVDALGFTAQAYADVNTKKKAFGISYSSKDSTKTAALSDEMNDQFTMIISSMGQTIRSAADVLGLGGEAFNAKLNTFVVDLGKISLKDLSGEEQQKALETAFSKLGDDMAKFGVAGLQQYQAVGEGYLETLVRVTNDFMQVSDVLAVLGKSFNTTGLGAVALSESLIAAAGGLDKLTSGTGFFVENFLTEAERMAPITKSVNDAMGRLGQSGVTTVE
ncbi:Phage-related minor tail protein, partial [Janthinobacterium sp. TND4EL3]|uniref:phage tail length tape measure family protein n=1 Tax=Janthinobacterium sp. TND4EL3 TaxID=1907311 RepID=UPI0009543198